MKDIKIIKFTKMYVHIKCLLCGDIYKERLCCGGTCIRDKSLLDGFLIICNNCHNATFNKEK